MRPMTQAPTADAGGPYALAEDGGATRNGRGGAGAQQGTITAAGHIPRHQALRLLAHPDARHLLSLRRVEDGDVVTEHVADTAVTPVGAEGHPVRPLADADFPHRF